jgi:toluene monooxygenase system protein A
MHELVRWNSQFRWAHKFYHTNNLVRHRGTAFLDELTLGQSAIEFHIATNVILETGLINLRFVGLASLAHEAGDYLFEKMVTSIRADEARHAQIGHPLLALVMKHDPDYAQYLIDKEFWRNWHLFSILTGVSMDYLTAADQRSGSFKEFMDEWIIDKFFRTLDEFGLKKPYYWDIFLDELEIYHHMIYASAYTYRQYCIGNVPSTGMTWTRCGNASESDGRMSAGADKESSALGTVLPAFCDLCQLPLAPELPTIIRPTSYRTRAKTMFSALNHVAGSSCASARDTRITWAK